MAEQINSALELMLVGMGIVFVFLIMLVAAVALMSWLLARYFPEPTPSNSDNLSSKIGGPENSDEVIAVIGAAIHRYRQNNKI